MLIRESFYAPAPVEFRVAEGIAMEHLDEDKDEVPQVNEGKSCPKTLPCQK